MDTLITASWQSALHLLYPKTCVSCDRFLPRHLENDLCLDCLSDFFTLDLGHHVPNSALNHFYGRCRIQHAHAHLSFKPGGKVQKMIHKIKYEGQTRVMRHFGYRIGREIQRMSWSSKIEAVTCVPIHWHRWYLRGYNQGAILGRAIAEKIGRPFYPHGLRRRRSTPSQTGLSRIQRVENLRDSIRCSKALVKHGHILLVDDVLTTGATVEACTLAIHDKADIDVSLACLAIGGM